MAHPYIAKAARALFDRYTHVEDGRVEEHWTARREELEAGVQDVLRIVREPNAEMLTALLEHLPATVSVAEAKAAFVAAIDRLLA